MQTPILGEARFASMESHTISDDVRIPERTEIGAGPGLQFELAGPRAKLFFDPNETRAGIVTCGGLCPGSIMSSARSLSICTTATGSPRRLVFAAGMAGCISRAVLNPSSLRDAPSVAYSTVYPLTTLLRIVCAQVLAIVLFR
ncbi:MAG TPA: hypothetical protein VGI85_01260 [Chthoniobacterales bacterium]|jgi:hypothetical protein